MDKESFKNMLKYSVIIFLFLSLFLYSACKKSEESQTTENDEEAQTTEDYFETILSDETSTETGTETGNEQQATEENIDEDDTNQEDNEEEYNPPSCGDSICTYYETYSTCAEDCDKLEEITLYNYPLFLGNGTYIVVGDDASSTDVITATVISTYLITKGIEVETILASEVEDFTSTDIILIGSPCVNDAIAELLHYDAETCDDVITEQNNAVIKLLVFETNEILIITGYDEEDTKHASTMLTDESYNLNGAEEWINLESDGDIAVYFSKN